MSYCVHLRPHMLIGLCLCIIVALSRPSSASSTLSASTPSETTRDSATSTSSETTRDSTTYSPSEMTRDYVTNITSKSTSTTLITEKLVTNNEVTTEEPEEPLSAGAIAGIVIGLVAVIVLIAGGVGCAVIYCKGDTKVSPVSNDVEIAKISTDHAGDVDDKTNLTHSEA